MPYFDEDVIRTCIQNGPNYVERGYESQLKDDNSSPDDAYQVNFEVLEYWGIMDAMYAREVGIDVPSSVDDLDETTANLKESGVQLIGEGGPQVFIHPKSANGVLVQLSVK